MTLGKIRFILILFCISLINSTVESDDKIITAPLINLEELKPSFEEIENIDVNQNINSSSLKEKKIINEKSKALVVRLLGLDKITAKTSEIKIKIGETKKFGPLEIKAIKCGEVDSLSNPGKVAYLQVKDLSKSQNEKIFIFNGWTFSSNPSLRPIEHAIYDLWLIGCDNV